MGVVGVVGGGVGGGGGWGGGGGVGVWCGWCRGRRYGSRLAWKQAVWRHAAWEQAVWKHAAWDRAGAGAGWCGGRRLVDVRMGLCRRRRGGRRRGAGGGGQGTQRGRGPSCLGRAVGGWGAGAGLPVAQCPPWRSANMRAIRHGLGGCWGAAERM